MARDILTEVRRFSLIGVQPEGKPGTLEAEENGGQEERKKRY
jgi:hypothetical protein